MIRTIAGLIKKTYNNYKMSYFSEPHFGKVKIDLNLENYATKADLKGATGIDTSNFAKTSTTRSISNERASSLSRRVGYKPNEQEVDEKQQISKEGSFSCLDKTHFFYYSISILSMRH